MSLSQEQIDYIETLYRKKAKLLFNYANLIFENTSLAEEAVQETFILACIKYQSLISSPNPEGWLINTHKNVCRNIHKTRMLYINRIIAMDDSVIPLGSTTDEYPSENGLCQLISDDEFYILKRTFIDGYSIKDIASELNITLAACYKRFEREKKKLFKQLTKHTKGRPL